MLQAINYQHIQGNVNDILPAGSPPLRATGTGMFLCLKGTAHIRIDERDYTISPHSLTIYFPYSVLNIISRSDDLDGFMLAVEIEAVQPLVFKIADIDSVLTISQDPQRMLDKEQFQTLMNYISLVLHHQALARRCLEEGNNRLWQLNNMQLENIKNTLILQVLIAFCNSQEKARPGISRHEAILHKFISLLKDNYQTQHEVSFYADKLCLSMRYFSSVVRDSSGKTPSQWIANALLNEAKRLLLETDHTIKEVSDELHFPNQSYFGKWFKAKTGHGPLDYKRHSADEQREIPE